MIRQKDSMNGDATGTVYLQHPILVETTFTDSGTRHTQRLPRRQLCNSPGTRFFAFRSFMSWVVLIVDLTNSRTAGSHIGDALTHDSNLSVCCWRLTTKIKTLRIMIERYMPA